MSIELTAEREQEILSNLCLVGGSAHPQLTRDIANHMGIPEFPITREVFDDTEGYIRFGGSIRKKEVIIVQPHVRHVGPDGKERSVDSAIMEQAMMIRAAFKSSASEITAVAPFLGYSRQDRRSKGREVGAVEIPLKTFKMLGANRVVCVDLHSDQVENVFDGIFDKLTAQPQLRAEMRKQIADFDQEEWIVVEPDAGAAKASWRHAQKLNVGTVAIRKIRDPNDSKKLKLTLDRDVNGRVCILFDDIADTAGTIVAESEMLKERGAKAIFVAVTHGLLSGPAVDRLRDAPIDRLLITDTVPSDHAQAELGDKLKVVKFAPVIAKALLAIMLGKSVSDIFEGQNYL